MCVGYIHYHAKESFLGEDVLFLSSMTFSECSRKTWKYFSKETNTCQDICFVKTQITPLWKKGNLVVALYQTLMVGIVVYVTSVSRVKLLAQGQFSWLGLSEVLALIIGLQKGLKYCLRKMQWLVINMTWWFFGIHLASSTFGSGMVFKILPGCGYSPALCPWHMLKFETTQSISFATT